MLKKKKKIALQLYRTLWGITVTIEDQKEEVLVVTFVEETEFIVKFIG